MIRLALSYFLIGIGIGGLMLANKAIGFYPQVWLLLPVHIEMMIFGWIIQFTLGTAYWILPRFTEGEPRGNEKLAVMIPVLLNLGILLIIGSHLFHTGQEIRVLGRIAETAAVPLFAALHWKRVSKMMHEH
jgi:hypothetical protein